MSTTCTTEEKPPSVKQVIVVRTKYPDGNGGTRKLRTGKLISQACHSSMAFLTSKMRLLEGCDKLQRMITLSEEERIWVDDKFTKICVYVETEDELLRVHENALAAGLTSYLITDSGLTEFAGVPTNTAVAVGPHESDKLQPITGGLPLL